jgi:hypothetical protein
MRLFATLFAVTLLPAVLAVAETPASWDASRFAAESTLQLRTRAPGDADHWFPVWLVVVDGQVYVRLGRRAAGRIASNTTAPWVGVRVGGREFERVRGEPAPEQAGRVADAMAAKYWSDVLVRHFPHPVTLRLVPEPEAAAARSPS